LFNFLGTMPADAGQVESLDVDGFQFREMSHGVATIGCHKIAFSEMARIAPEVETLAHA